MGTKRIGLARIEALMENLKREINFGAGTKLVGHRIPVESVTADDTLTAAESGTTYLFTDAAATLTLPDSGAGDLIGVTYTFVSIFTATAQKVICTDTTNEILIGALVATDTDLDTTVRAWNAEVADAYDFVLFSGVETGAIGSTFTVTNYAADRWLVSGVVIQESGAEAIPFGTT